MMSENGLNSATVFHRDCNLAIQKHTCVRTLSASKGTHSATHQASACFCAIKLDPRGRAVVTANRNHVKYTQKSFLWSDSREGHHGMHKNRMAKTTLGLH